MDGLVLVNDGRPNRPFVQRNLGKSWYSEHFTLAVDLEKLVRAGNDGDRIAMIDRLSTEVNRLKDFLE